MLRKLTFKSTMKFGKYADMTVQQIIDMGRGQYLLWAYFRNSDIDFFPDVLDRLSVIESQKIKKPGKISKEEFKNIMDKRICIIAAKSEDPVKTLSIIRNGGKARAKAHYKTLIEKDRIYFSKASLVWRNHGHF